MDTLNTVPSSGTFGDVVDYINANFTLVQEAISEADESVGKGKGAFSSLSDLQTAYPTANDADWAIVYDSSDTCYYIYVYSEDNAAWEQGGIFDSSIVSTAQTEIDTAVATAISDAEADITTAKEEAIAELETYGAVDVVQATGSSTTSVMSQNAVTEYIGNLEATNTDALYITDADGYAVAKIDENGIQSVGIIDPDGGDIFDSIQSSNYSDAFYVSDNYGKSVFRVNSDGITATAGYFGNIINNDWYGKNIAFYGDSVVAVTNGDFSEPYTLSSTNWGIRVATYFSFANFYGRGIGGQGYKWTTAGGSGGSVSFINTDGTYNSRDDSYTYDDYTGSVPSGTTAVRGCLASWLRITTMFPESIKDDINAVVIMAHNDSYDTTDCAFIESDTTDTEWAASSYYSTIGGDYDLTTLRGGIASTIMKLQLWMPDAIIILCSGISGSGTTGEINTDINSSSLLNIAEATREMSKLTAVPIIDTSATDGINGWNRTTYISDTIHPYTTSGRDMFARAIIGGLKNILPNY